MEMNGTPNGALTMDYYSEQIGEAAFAVHLPPSITSVAISPHYNFNIHPESGHHAILNPPPAQSPSISHLASLAINSPNNVSSPSFSPYQHASSSLASPTNRLRTSHQRPLPTSLPATPRLPSGSIPTKPLPPHPLQRLRTNYTHMLGQRKKSPTSSMPPPPDPPQATMVDTLEDLNKFLSEGESPAPSTASPPFLTPPTPALVSPDGDASFGAGADFLSFLGSPTSPMLQQPLQSFNTPTSAHLQSFTSPFPYTSPLMDDDLSRFLATPASALSHSSVAFSPDVYNSPSLELWEGAFAMHTPLFTEESASKSQTALGLTTTLQRVSSSGSSSSYPPTPSLESDRRPNHHKSYSATTIPPSPSLSNSSNVPNGHRKNIQVKDLLSLDAPTQPRSYITPSATSRKEIPASVARTFVPPSPAPRKRSATQAGLTPAEDLHDASASPGMDGGDDLAALGIEASGDPLLDHIALKRRQNTLAARKSRQRKLETARLMDELVERLTQERDDYKLKCEQLEEELRAAGLR